MATHAPHITGPRAGGIAADVCPRTSRALARALVAACALGGFGAMCAYGAPQANPNTGAAITTVLNANATHDRAVDDAAVELVGPVPDETVPAPTEHAESTPTVSADVESRPLGVARARAQPAPRKEGGASFADNWIVRTVGALSVVIGLIVALRAVVRRVALGSGGIAGQLSAGGRAPSGVLYVLGRYPVARGQTLVLLQVDRRVLLLNQTSQGFTTLAEITDPNEVASIMMRTRDEEGASMAERFRTLLRGMERDPSIAGEFDAQDAGWPRQRDPIGSVRRRLASLREGA